MKKRLLSALLALALVFVLLPTTALAGVTKESDYDISIDGKRYKFDSDGSGGYTTAYYQENNGKTPTSNYEDVWQTNPYLEITRVDNIITITVKIGSKGPGKSVTIGASTQDINYECIAVNGAIDLIITGDTGTSLTLNKTYCGAALSATKGNITITDGVKVTASFKNKAVDNYVFYAIWAQNLTVSGANTEVTASGNCEDAIHVSGTVTVSKGAKLTATNDHNDKYKPYPITKSSAIKSDVLTIADENSCVIAQAIDSSYGKPLRIQNYNIAGATIKAGSSNYNSTETTIDKIDGNTYVKISVPALQKTSDVLIAGKNAVVGQCTNIPAATGTGSYSYDADKKELTLKDVNITSGINAIQFMANGAYTIKLEGENKISNVSNGISLSDDQYITSLNVTITGTGSLDISAKGLAINMKKGDLKFENTGAIKLATGNIGLNNNALSVKGNITITDMSKYSVTGTQQTGGKPLGSEVSLTEASQLKGGTTGYRIITITPAAAKDSTISYNRKTLKQGGIITGENGGTATVDSKNNTITLDNFKGNYPLEFNAEFTPNSITLIGDSTLSAVETKYQNLTISGSGSLTVGSIRVPNNTQNTANLTITGGAHVTVNRPSGEDEPAVEVSGNLTVTGDGTQLSAECTAATNPAIEVGGNVTISGNPGTNAYTVKAYNKYATPRGRDDKLRPSQMPSAIEISGDSLSISNSAQVMAKTDSDGAAVWMPKQKVISVVDASLIAQNRSHNFSTISFGDESNMGNIYAKGQVNIVAENMLGSNSRLAHRAIKAYIYNHYSTGDSNPYYIKVVSEGVQSGGNVNVIPGDCTSTGGYKVTITRGDAYVAPTKTITEIIVTGLTPPVKGATPVDKSKVTLTDGLTVESITWGPALTSDGKFAANTAYTAHINYSVKAGYELAANANCPQVAGANVTRWHQEGMPQDEIEVTFPKTAADTPTEKPTITLDLPAPVAGVAPVTTGVTATSSDNTPLTIDKVEWYAYTVEYNNGKFERIVEGDKVSGNFEANTYYFAEITFDRSIYFANEGLNIIAPTWPLEGSWPESRIYRVIENSYTARILFPATDAACNHQPGDWQDGTDGEHHVKVCAICHNVVATESHAFGGYQINTNNSHTRVCSVCNAAYTNAHEFNSYAHNENSHWKVCVCGATTSYANHEFDPATGACACGATQSGGNPTPDVPAAPTGLAGVAPTSANSKDGKITGTTAAMEYATEPNGSNWIECGGDEVTGLSAGTYYVRYKRTTDKPASAVATVVVPAYSGGGEIVPPTPDNPGTIVIIRPAEEEKPAQQPNPSTGANDLVGLAVAAAVAAALGSAALLRKHD